MWAEQPKYKEKLLNKLKCQSHGVHKNRFVIIN